MANHAFTDEMAIEIGGLDGVSLVWRDKSEQWQDDCVGAKKKQGAKVMCWGMIGWNYKGPFHIWEKETVAEKAAAAEKIAALNAGWQAVQTRLNAEWKKTEEWRQLRERELKAAQEARVTAALKGEKCGKATQSFRGNKYKKEHNLKRGDVKAIDSRRYVTV